MGEYAYFDGIVKGNSREMIEYFEKIKRLFDAGILAEIAFFNGKNSFFAAKEPIPVAVRVEGDIGEAKFQALKLLKDLGYVSKEVWNFEEVFQFVEKIEKMPLEDFLREVKKLRELI